MAAAVWLQNLSLLSTQWPLLVAIPIVYLAAKPWPSLALAPSSSVLPLKEACLFAVLFGVGSFAGSVFLQACAWAALARYWLLVQFPQHRVLSQVGVFFVLLASFPWLQADFPILGWWLRLLGASFTAWLFSFSGFDVIHQGTLVYANEILHSIASRIETDQNFVRINKSALVNDIKS
ncbi:MAG: hypothetical protein AAF558_05370 [Verrucomicrobiota bacterium]